MRRSGEMPLGCLACRLAPSAKHSDVVIASQATSYSYPMKRFAPSAERNQQPIGDVFSRYLRNCTSVLEIASGTGQHAVHLAASLPHLTWQPSDVDFDNVDSIKAYVAEADLPNLRAPIELDVTGEWPRIACDAVVCINMVHISPWHASEGLLRGASQCLPVGAPLLLYGPYIIDGDYQAQSNVEFHQWLRRRNPAWGVRELRDVEREAKKWGFTLADVQAMPANNHTVVFRRTT